MGKFTGYLIVSDLDGTLINDDHEVSEKNAQAIRYFIKNGGRFTVATGRIREEVTDFLDDLIMNVPAIISNGGMIYDFNSDFMIMERFLPHHIEEFASHVMEKFPEAGVMVVADGHLIMVRKNKIFIDDAELYGTHTRPSKALSELGESWAKVLFSIEEEKMPELEAYLRTHASDVEVVQSYATSLELLPKGVTKGDALKFVMRGLRVNPNKVFALGDNMNDYAMLETVPNGWCVDNANPRLKEVASRIMPNHNDSAVAAMIEAVEAIVDDRMKADQELAKFHLVENDCTLAFAKNGKVIYDSHERGIRPMYEALKAEVNLKGAVLADRVIGRAAAMLALSAGIKSIHTFVVSESALDVCRKKGFDKIAYEEVSPYVMNRTQDDLCPIEKLSQTTDDPVELMEKIEVFLKG